MTLPLKYIKTCWLFMKLSLPFHLFLEPNRFWSSSEILIFLPATSLGNKNNFLLWCIKARSKRATRCFLFLAGSPTLNIALSWTRTPAATFPLPLLPSTSDWKLNCDANKLLISNFYAEYQQCDLKVFYVFSAMLTICNLRHSVVGRFTP